MTTLADDLQTMGVTALRELDPTLVGTGVSVAQPEAIVDGIEAFEVNPAAVGEDESFFDWISTNGIYTTFPNPAGTESSHADGVAAQIFGQTQGVAPGLLHDDNSEADYFFAHYIGPPATAVTDSIVNQSFAFFTTNVSDQQEVDGDYDDYVAEYGGIFSSGPNGINGGVGPPGTAYNCIAVGAYGAYAVVTEGPTIDNGRSKPDIVAPGVETSFTIPYVTGAAAVLLQAARRGDGGAGTNAQDWRTIKALLQNGALKPYNWSHTTNAPLDRNYGAGVVNVYYSYQQLAAGSHTFSTSTSSMTPASGNPIASLLGWDFESITTLVPDENTVNHYVFNVSFRSTLTATLDWERQFAEDNINQLALFLYNATNQTFIACSDSAVDNVQHIYVPNLSPGTYDLEVVKYGGASQMVTPSEQYALAYDFFPLTAPSLSLVSTTNGAVLTWPSSPTVFVLQGAAGLTPPIAWTNVTAPEWITNSTVYVNLGTTGATGFYRLMR